MVQSSLLRRPRHEAVPLTHREFSLSYNWSTPGALMCPNLLGKKMLNHEERCVVFSKKGSWFLCGCMWWVVKYGHDAIASISDGSLVAHDLRFLLSLLHCSHVRRSSYSTVFCWRLWCKRGCEGWIANENMWISCRYISASSLWGLNVAWMCLSRIMTTEILLIYVLQRLLE